MPHNDAFKKLSLLWDKLRLRDTGPEFEVTAKEKNKSLEIIKLNVSENKGMYEPTAKKWAYGIYKHCEVSVNPWFEELLQYHQFNNTADYELPFPYQKMSCRSIINSLIDYNFHPDNRKSNIKTSEPITFSENSWFTVFRDSFTIDSFEFVFGIRSEPPEHSSVVTTNPTAINSHTPKNTTTPNGKISDLDLIRSKWYPNFESDFRTIESLQGYYLMYRSERVDVPPKDKTYDIPYGWFGLQKIRVIPVSIHEQDNCLIWHDYYPDPSDLIHETIGVVIEGDDKAFDIYGIDKETYNTGRFFGRFKSLRRKDATQGAIFGNNRYSGGIESYRFWLKRVNEATYLNVKRQCSELSKFFHDVRNSFAEKTKKYENDHIIFTSVSELLQQHESDLVHYLFLPSGSDPDDLRMEETVRKVTYTAVRKPMETF